MGVVDLRDAFNSVAQPAFTCAKATLHYERANDTEWQMLTFYGTAARDGAEFIQRAARARPDSDLLDVSRRAAQLLLDRGKP